uniref:Delta(14)-sterol reductase n=2 Tax=Hemiselmis andersenii TaxID=464988 RepID=A0A7S1MYI5_HEMAN
MSNPGPPIFQAHPSSPLIFSCRKPSGMAKERTGRSPSSGGAARGKSGSPARSPSPSKEAKKAKFEYEFGGPVGTTANVVLLPLLILFLYFACPAVKDGTCLPGIDITKLTSISVPPLSSLLSPFAFALVTAWFFFLYLLELCLPKVIAYGTPLVGTGERLPYRINGHLSFWVSLLVVEHAPWQGTGLVYLYDHFVEVAVAASVFSALLSIGLFVASFRKGAVLAEGGVSGCWAYDFWMGRELNPRIGGWDLKVFCELRPGLIGWMVLNLAMAAKERQVLGHSSLAMVLINVSQGYYVWDALYHEQAILSTMDVTTDGFGYMLAFGDLAWVPFTYCIPARYLAEHPSGLSNTLTLLFALVGVFGFFVFRSANSQKDTFRRDPNGICVKHLKFMNTKRGTRLLVSGWWGMARKINYTGDWLLGLSWSLLAGFGSIVCYFYPIYFAVLLVHRAWRDDHACSKKYGNDWIEYKKKVPYMFVPGLV